MSVFEPTCAYAWWAHMRRFLSVTGPKFTRPKITGQNPYLQMYRTRDCGTLVTGPKGEGQRSHGSRSNKVYKEM